jgi:hypothetical protein
VALQEDDRITEALELERRATALRAEAHALFSAADHLRNEVVEERRQGPGLWASRFTDSSAPLPTGSSSNPAVASNSSQDRF